MNKRIKKVASELKDLDSLMEYRKKVAGDSLFMYAIMGVLGIPIVNGFFYGVSPILAFAAVSLECAIGIYACCHIIFLGFVIKELTGHFGF